MERRVRPSTSQIAGATLTISTMGGYSVLVGDDYLGYMHASQGDLFNTYQRVPGKPDNWLGKYPQDAAVHAIMTACGRVPAKVA